MSSSWRYLGQNFFNQFLILICCVVLATGCSSSKNDNKPTSAKPAPQVSLDSPLKNNSLEISKKNDGEMTNQPRPFVPFTVYKDKGYERNHFVPSGYMPTGECIAMDEGYIEKCFEGKTCIQAKYDSECSRMSRKWAGVY